MAISKIILNGVTQMDLTSDTVAAANLIAPNTAHGADGEPVVGAASAGGGGTVTIEEIPNATGTTLQITTNGSGGGGSTPSLQTKSVSYTPTTSTQTATVTADTGYDGLEQVNVSVGAIPSGYIIPSGTKSISANGTGIDVTNFAAVDVNVSSGGGTPSATQHSIYFEFSDETNTTITAYWDDSFISNAITATEPTTYGQKTVDSASLDGVTWYTRLMETWETILDENRIDYYPENDPTEPPYCWISALSDIHIAQNSVWRVTFDGVMYDRLIATYAADGGANYAFGNPLYLPSRQDDGSGVPFAFYSTDFGAWSGSANVANSSSHSVKIERLITS